MNATNKTTNTSLTGKLTIDTPELQALMGCGRKSAVEIGEQAGARIQIGKRVLWNVEKVRTYVNLICE